MNIQFRQTNKPLNLPANQQIVMIPISNNAFQ